MRYICLVWLFFVCLVLLPEGVAASEIRQGRKTGLEEDDSGFLQALLPTPVYSVPDIISLYYSDSDWSSPELKLDAKGHMRELEFIALPGTKFVVKQVLRYDWGVVYEVTTRDYSSARSIYVTADFVTPCAESTPERSYEMPERAVILQRLRRLVGEPYCWGGNYSPGIEKLLELYPLGDKAEDETFMCRFRGKWALDGVDCSGMLYEATDGSTPRNTSELVNYGKAVAVAGLNAREIADRLKPLDLLVWNGHVVVVFDKDKVIESRPRYPDGHPGGVRIQRLLPRLEELLQTRMAVDDYLRDNTDKKRFVVRRFIAARDD